MVALQAVNLGIRFVLEVCAVGLVSYLAYRAVDSSGWATVAAVAAPLGVVVAWSLFAAPKAAVVVPGPWKVAVQLSLLLLPAAGLALAGKTTWAGAFASAVVANAALMAWWDQ